MGNVIVTFFTELLTPTAPRCEFILLALLLIALDELEECLRGPPEDPQGAPQEPPDEDPPIYNGEWEIDE